MEALGFLDFGNMKKEAVEKQRPATARRYKEYKNNFVCSVCKKNAQHSLKSPRPLSARRKKKDDEEDSDPDFINDEDEEDDESSSSSSSDDEYWDEINEAESVEDGMKILLKRDPETFYCYGERVKEMLKYKLQNNW